MTPPHATRRPAHARTHAARVTRPIAMAGTLALTMACAGRGRDRDRGGDQDEAPLPPPKAAAEDGSVRLIGTIARDGVPACGDPATWWTGVHWQLSGVPLVADDARAPHLEDLRGRPAIVEGIPGETPPSTSTLGPDPGADPNQPNPACVMQLRDDWRPTPDGLRVGPAGSLPFGALSVRTVTRYTGLGAELDEDSGVVRVSLINDVGVPLSAIALTLEYDECTGKPGSRSVDIEHSRLDTLSTLEHAFPALLGVAEARADARSVPAIPARLRARARGDGVFLDLSLQMSQLGVLVECPEPD